MLQEAQRPLDTLQGRGESAPPVGTRLAGLAGFAQQLQRVPEVFAGCLHRWPDPSPRGPSTPVQGAPALGATPAIDHAPPLVGGSREGAAARGCPPVNAAAPVEDQSAGQRAGS